MANSLYIAAMAPGIGEKSPRIRAGSCRGLSHLGFEVDTDRNSRWSKDAFEIQTRESTVKVHVIPTNEELEIAEQTVACIHSLPNTG